MNEIEKIHWSTFRVDHERKEVQLLQSHFDIHIDLRIREMLNLDRRS